MSLTITPEYRYPLRDGEWAIVADLPPIPRALRHLANGLRFGYPLCCVAEFCLDCVDGRLPGIRRGNVPTGSGGVYVPCSRCCSEMGREVCP